MKPRMRAIISYIVIGFFAGASGTYLFEHGLRVSVAGLLGIAGILAGLAVGAGFNWSKLDRARRTRAISNVSQARTRWDYRPRHGHGIQRVATLDREGTESLDATSQTRSATTVDHDVWFDFGSANPSPQDVPMNTLPPKAYD
jgi:hypothetical protein